MKIKITLQSEEVIPSAKEGDEGTVELIVDHSCEVESDSGQIPEVVVFGDSYYLLSDFKHASFGVYDKCPGITLANEKAIIV